MIAKHRNDGNGECRKSDGIKYGERRNSEEGAAEKTQRKDITERK